VVSQVEPKAEESPSVDAIPHFVRDDGAGWDDERVENKKAVIKSDTDHGQCRIKTRNSD